MQGGNEHYRLHSLIHIFNHDSIHQDLDWNCGLVVCNYAVGGNTPAGKMYKVRCTSYEMYIVQGGEDLQPFLDLKVVSVLLSTHTINYSRWAILAATAQETQHVTRPLLPFARNLPQAQQQHLL